MSSHVFCFVLFIGLVGLLGLSEAKPRDVGIQQTKDGLIRVQLQQDEIKFNEAQYFNNDIKEGNVGHQCEFEEAVEHDECASICIPKGYTYGLCIRFKCTCI